MSCITTAIMLVSGAPREVEAQLEQPLPFDDRGQSFRKIDTDAAGGFKVFPMDLYAAAFNYVSSDDLENWFLALPWDVGAAAVLVLDEKDAKRMISLPPNRFVP